MAAAAEAGDAAAGRRTLPMIGPGSCHCSILLLSAKTFPVIVTALMTARWVFCEAGARGAPCEPGRRTLRVSERGQREDREPERERGQRQREIASEHARVAGPWASDPLLPAPQREPPHAYPPHPAISFPQRLPQQQQRCSWGPPSVPVVARRQLSHAVCSHGGGRGFGSGLHPLRPGRMYL